MYSLRRLWELAFAEERTKEPTPCVGLLLLLKTFQRLGYFIRLDEIPKSIVRQVCKAAGFEEIPDGLAAYDASTAQHRHMVLVRSWLGATPFDRNARRVMVEASVHASRVREDLADIINTAIEELVRQRFELPAFSALMRAGIPVVKLNRFAAEGLMEKNLLSASARHWKKWPAQPIRGSRRIVTFGSRKASRWLLRSGPNRHRKAFRVSNSC
jgi:histone H3/H4